MKKKLAIIITFVIFILPLYSQSIREGAQDMNRSSTGATIGAANRESLDLPLKRIALLSSGVGYFEHSGPVNSASSPVEIILPFDADAVNDALKSLVINDPSSSSPSVRYAAQNTLLLTLKSLKIDMSGSPGIGEILNGQKGAELEIAAPNPIRGRIVGVEHRPGRAEYSLQSGNPRPADEEWLSLFTSGGIRLVAIKDITSFKFTDEKINADLDRALDLIMSSGDLSAKNLHVTLNGTGNREVSLTYVIPTPVWKVSYRLDLSGRNNPFLQGWAIVDNDSNMDWNGVELSLVTGRPVSFIQNLYPPYRLSRPVVPLAIAGFAEGRAHEGGYETLGMEVSKEAAESMRSYELAEMDYTTPMMNARQGGGATAPAVTGGVVDTAAGRTAGDQFEFTLKTAVSLERRQSAMFPLVEGVIKAEKVLVFSGSRASRGGTINPEIGAELTNSSGMKLPAGPITVYDGGTYAGDALIEFFPENEMRLITYGEDLSVTGSLTSTSSRYVTGVNIVGGVMTINRRQSSEREYTIRSASNETKKLIIEHPIAAGYELEEPKTAEDRTGTLYRFKRNLAPKEVLVFKVKEETPVYERITLAQLRPEVFLSYTTNQEIPANVRAALTRAIELKKRADDAAAAQVELENQLSRLFTEQDRIRRNLEAAGNSSPQGQEYLRRLSDTDKEIDSLGSQIKSAGEKAQEAKRDYDNYLADLMI